MRILAALTLLISVFLSPVSTATPLELKWTVDVDEAFLGGFELRYIGPLLPTPDGGCVGRAHIVFDGTSRRLLFALDRNGEIRWRSSPSTIPFPATFWVISNDFLVFKSSGTFMSVDLNSGELTRMTGLGEVWSTNGKDSVTVTEPRLEFAGSGIPITNAIEDSLPRRPVIQMWAPASPTPDLAPSTFGLEDGNLIISWPTDAGQTYQVQRSTDLESWENIGVALTGNGTTMSYAQPSNADKVFLRVVIP